MGLESGSFPSDLVTGNPTGGDDKSQGDDHIRLIKNVLKTTFPNIDGAVTSTQAQLNAIQDTDSFFQTGMIIMWSGSVSALPTGWLLCNGASGTPNLTGRFVVASATDAGGVYDVGDIGGTAVNNHSHTGNVEGHAITAAEMPAHNHISGVPHYDGAYGLATIPAKGAPAGSATNRTTSPNTSTVGSNTAHSHNLTINTTNLDNRPPYYALAFIMKS
jgi:hypothetical protein